MAGMHLLFLFLSLFLMMDSHLSKTVCAAVTQKGENETISSSDEISLHDFRQLKQLVYQLNHTVTGLQWAKRDDVLHTCFLAVATESGPSYTTKAIIKFPKVKHSVAPPNFGYDALISFYRCPYNGTYVFGFSITTATSSKHNRFSIVKEGQTIASAQAYDSTGYQGMSTMVITTCKKGEDVWVANTAAHTTAVYNPVEGDVHFTGFRLL